MAVRRGLLLAVAVAALGGCVAAASAAPSKSTDPLPLTKRVLRPGDFRDFRRRGPFKVERNLLKWAGTALPIVDLRQNGFVAGLRETMWSNSLRSTAVSAVAQYRSARAARRQLQAEVDAASQRGSNYLSFDVHSIPGAQGYRLSHKGLPGYSGSMGYNVVFSDGPYVYLVGFGFDLKAKKHRVSKAQTIEVARRLYLRVHGHPAA